MTDDQKAPLAVPPVLKVDNVSDTVEIALIESRLTIAGFILAIFFFSGAFALQLFTTPGHGKSSDVAQIAQSKFESDTALGQRTFHVEFSHIEFSVALGTTTTLLVIVFLMLCQQLPLEAEDWRQSRRWWFTVSTVWLYFSLAQAMAACLTEIAFGVSLASPSVGQALSVAAFVVWFMLLLGAPVHLILRVQQRFRRGGRAGLWIAYATPLIFFLYYGGELERLREKNPESLLNSLWHTAGQLILPLTWVHDWGALK